jgi:hypothetical protein
MEGLLTNPSSSGWGYHAATAITILGHRSLSAVDRTKPKVRFKPKNLLPFLKYPGYHSVMVSLSNHQYSFINKKSAI